MFFRLRDLPEKQATPNKLETVVERVMRLREQQKLGENSNENKDSPSRKSEKVKLDNCFENIESALCHQLIHCKSLDAQSII